MTSATPPRRQGISRSRLSILGVLAAIVGCVAVGYWVGTGSWIALGVVCLLVAALLSLADYPILGLALIVVVCLFDEYAYGVLDPGGFFLLRRYFVPYTPFVADEFIVYSMVAILLIQVARGRSLRLPGKTVTLGVVSLATVYWLQVLRAMTDGNGFGRVFTPQGGKYLLFLCVALLLFVHVLESAGVRLRVLDLMYALCGGRATFAMVRFVLGDGDPANAYRDQLAKVALWDSSDHLLFSVLVLVALAALMFGGVSRQRLVLWLAATVPMSLVIAFSYRREGWVGILASIALLAIASWRKGGKLLLAGVGVVLVGGLPLSYARFSTGSSFMQRVLPDFVSGGGVSRLTESALAWVTISADPIFGGGPLAERAGGVFFWTTQIVHSGALFVWMKMGLFGLAALLWIIVSAFGSGLRASKRGGPEAYLATALTCAVPFIVLEMAFSTPLLQVRTTLVYAFMMALMCVLDRQGTWLAASSTDDSTAEIGGDRTD